MESAHQELANLSRLYVLSRAIHTVAKLGVANYMSSIPVDVNELAKKTGTKALQLDRVLNFLSAYRVFSQQESGYSLTPLSKPLRDDDPHSIRDVLCMADENWWQAFSQMDETLKNGKSAFFNQHGDDFFSFLGKNPQKQANFDRGMAKLSTYDDPCIAEAYNFGAFSTLIDMGGGRGGLSQAIVKSYPELVVTLFDTPSVISQLKTSDFPKSINLEAGDFFDKIPEADAYIFKGVLHDFDDNLMTKILKNLRRQVSKDATLLIAEQVMPEENEPHPNKTMDLVMMVLLGGRQRTLSEWQKDIEPTGFKFIADYPTKSIFRLMEFKVK